jgi:hypothetical protein
MALTIDWTNKLVNSTSSITDIVAFKNTIRDYEDDAEGMLHDTIITYKRLDLGGGAYFHQVDLINGYKLKFTIQGSYEIIGNINAIIDPTANTFVERKTSAAFSSTSGSASALTNEQDIMLRELWKLSGLNAATPLTVSDTNRSVGDIHQAISDNGTTTTVQRV